MAAAALTVHSSDDSRNIAAMRLMITSRMLPECLTVMKFAEIQPSPHASGYAQNSSKQLGTASESAACLDYDSFQNSTVIANVAKFYLPRSLGESSVSRGNEIGMSLQVTSTTTR